VIGTSVVPVMEHALRRCCLERISPPARWNWPPYFDAGWATHPGIAPGVPASAGSGIPGSLPLARPTFHRLMQVEQLIRTSLPESRLQPVGGRSPAKAGTPNVRAVS